MTATALQAQTATGTNDVNQAWSISSRNTLAKIHDVIMCSTQTETWQDTMWFSVIKTTPTTHRMYRNHNNWAQTLTAATASKAWGEAGSCNKLACNPWTASNTTAWNAESSTHTLRTRTCSYISQNTGQYLTGLAATAGCTPPPAHRGNSLNKQRTNWELQNYK